MFRAGRGVAVSWGDERDLTGVTDVTCGAVTEVFSVYVIAETPVLAGVRVAGLGSTLAVAATVAVFTHTNVPINTI